MIKSFSRADIKRALAHSRIKSFELHVFLRGSRVPDRAAWQNGIDRLGFATTLDEKISVRVDVGFLKATYEGRAAGFNFALSSASNILSLYPHIAPRIGERDTCATFITGGDLPETFAVLSSAAALAQFSDGVWFFPAANIFQSADEAVETARAAQGLHSSIEGRFIRLDRLRWIIFILAALAIVFMLFAR